MATLATPGTAVRAQAGPGSRPPGLSRCTPRPAKTPRSPSPVRRRWPILPLFLALSPVIATAQAEAPQEVPAHARDWECEWSYRKSGGACVAVVAPANAHIGYSGDNWTCNPGYRRRGDTCSPDGGWAGSGGTGPSTGAAVLSMLSIRARQ